MIIFCLFSLITVLSDTPDSLILKYTVEYKKNKIGNKVKYELKDGGIFPEERGLPALPSIKKEILTPVKGKVDLKYKVLSTHTPLAGRDAIARGVPSGHEVGELLAAVEDWWLRQDRRPDRAACLDELARRVEAGVET